MRSHAPTAFSSRLAWLARPFREDTGEVARNRHGMLEALNQVGKWGLQISADGNYGFEIC